MVWNKKLYSGSSCLLHCNHISYV